jgi:NADH:ubiquinone oxidoreductase subunit C
MDQFLRGLVFYLFAGFLNLVQSLHANYFLELELHKGKAVSVALMLKTHSEYLLSSLIDVLSIDKPGPRFRFTVLYSVFSHILNNRVFFSYQFKEGAPIESLINLFEASAWAEREC